MSFSPTRKERLLINIEIYFDVKMCKNIFSPTSLIKNQITNIELVLVYETTKLIMGPSNKTFYDLIWLRTFLTNALQVKGKMCR